jgi:hypothetical protein
MAKDVFMALNSLTRADLGAMGRRRTSDDAGKSLRLLREVFPPKVNDCYLMYLIMNSYLCRSL